MMSSLTYLTPVILLTTLLLCCNIGLAVVIGTNASVSASPNSRIATVGSSVIFNCSISKTNGNLPTAGDIRWYKGSNPLPENGQRRILDDRISQLVLSNVQVTDGGSYTCCLAPPRCTSKVDVQLEVGLPPDPVRNLTCYSRSPEYGYCIWNNSTNDDNQIKPSHTLERTPSNRKDWTEAPCEEKPHGVIINADNVCYLPLLEDKDFNYRVVSRNTFGETVTNMTSPAEFSIFNDAVPYPPQNFIVQAETSNSIVVKWNSPTEFGKRYCRALGYKIRHNYGMKSDWIGQMDINRFSIEGNICEPAFTIDNLGPPYANVCVELAAEPYLSNINKQTKVWSEWSETKCVRLLQEAPSEAPGEFNAERKRNEKSRKWIDVHLTWRPLPADKQNGEILGYNITVTGSLDSNMDYWSTYFTIENATEFVIPDLNKTHQYTIDIVASNEAGSSPRNTVRITPIPVEAPDLAPGDFKAKSKRNEKSQKWIDVYLTWRPLPEDEWNGKILGYIITVTGSLDSKIDYKSTYKALENASEFVVQDLNKTHQYTIDIVAYNIGGNSPRSTVSIGPTLVKESNLFIIMAVAIVLPLAILVSIIICCSWKKISQQQKFEVQMPSIVKRSNYYTNTISTSFRTQEPEQFDDLSDRQNNQYCTEINGAGPTRNASVTINVYENFPNDRIDPAEFNCLLEGHTCDEYIDEDTNGLESVDLLLPPGSARREGHNSMDSGKSSLLSKDDSRDICYHTMTPQGLSPVRQCPAENHSDDGSDTNQQNKGVAMVMANGPDVSALYIQTSSLPGTPTKIGSGSSGCFDSQDFDAVVHSKPPISDAKSGLSSQGLLSAEIHPYVQQGQIPTLQNKCVDLKDETSPLQETGVDLKKSDKEDQFNQMSTPNCNTKTDGTCNYIKHNNQTQGVAMCTAGRQLHNLMPHLAEGMNNKDQDKTTPSLPCHTSQTEDHHSTCSSEGENGGVLEEKGVSSADHDMILIEPQMTADDQTADMTPAFDQVSAAPQDTPEDVHLINSFGGSCEGSTCKIDPFGGLGTNNNKPITEINPEEQSQSIDSSVDDIPNYCISKDILQNRTGIGHEAVDTRTDMNPVVPGLAIDTTDFKTDSSPVNSNHDNAHDRRKNIPPVMSYPSNFDCNTGYLHLASLKACNTIPSRKISDDGYSSVSNGSPPDSPTEVFMNKLSG